MIDRDSEIFGVEELKTCSRTGHQMNLLITDNKSKSQP